jgi:hypothetical protein
MLKQISFGLAVIAIASASVHAAQPATDAEIRQAVIQESIAAYRGNCPCPYNAARNGSRCGARSAYSRPGGASPLCFPQDVTQRMVDDYRREHTQAR